MEECLCGAYFIVLVGHIKDRPKVRTKADIPKGTITLFHQLTSPQITNNKPIKIDITIHNLMLMSNRIEYFIFHIHI